MNHTTTNKSIPVIAILAPNTLMGLGLKSILEGMLPFALFRVCDEFAEIEHTAPEELFHIFVSANVVMEHRAFFETRRAKCIILTSGTPYATLLDGYPQINISAPQRQIEAQFRALHGAVHGERNGSGDGGEMGGQHAPHAPHPQRSEREILTPREIEVLQLLVEGLLNKEIAQRLNIGLTTVISHRKNIIEKLGVKSVAGLTIYAVMKRYIVI